MIERQVEGVAELHEASGLVGSRRVDRTGEVRRVVGEHADRPALDPGQRGDHPQPEVAPQLEHRTGVEEQVDRPTHVVAAQPVGGHDLAQQRLVGARPIVDASLEVGQVALGDGDRLGLVGDDDVDDAVGALHVDRPDRGRLVHAQPATLDHRRPAHADVRVERWR